MAPVRVLAILCAVSGVPLTVTFSKRDLTHYQLHIPTQTDH
jgi:hypothetical protein